MKKKDIYGLRISVLYKDFLEKSMMTNDEGGNRIRLVFDWNFDVLDPEGWDWKGRHRNLQYC